MFQLMRHEKKVMWHEILLEIVRFAVQLKGGTISSSEWPPVCLRFQRSRSRSCSSSPSLVRMVRASRSPLVRSANANRKSTAANEAESIVKRGKRGYHTNEALFGRGMSRSTGPRGAWTGLAPSGRLSTPLTHMAGFIFWALTGRSEKHTARSARGSASRRDGPKSFFSCIWRS